MAKITEVKLECPVCKLRRIVDTVPGLLIDAACPDCKTIMKEVAEFNEEKPDILNEVHSIINGERQDNYGNPEDSFKIIAEFWSTYIKYKFGIVIELSDLDTAHMMSLLKQARMLGQRPARDNYIDACGYLAIAADRLLTKD